MNVNGLATTIARPFETRPTKTDRSEKTSTSRSAARISLTTVNNQSALKLIADKSYAKILETTNAAAKELGYDLNTLDTSPEATSSRIADFAVGLFGLYKQQHPELGDEEALSKYETLIKGAVTSGYREALGVLKGLGVNDRSILDTAQKTIDMVFEKLDRFFQSKREDLAQAESEAGVASEA